MGLCGDCGVEAGKIHLDNCDVERCSACGDQRLSCFCDGEHDRAFARWTGFWPGKIEADALGIDLNKLYELGLHKALFVKPESLSVDNRAPEGV